MSGQSQLTTRRCDLANCTLEGKLEKYGGSLEFRVAVDDAENPARYAYWKVGKVIRGAAECRGGQGGPGQRARIVCQAAGRRPAYRARSIQDPL